MEKVLNERDLKCPTPELLRKMTEEFSFIDFYKLEGYKAGIVVTPEQVAVMISPEIMKRTDNSSTFHVFHRSFFKSIYEKIEGDRGEKEKSRISPMNISCLSTDYANFCFIEMDNSDQHIITNKMMEVVNKIMRIIWAHPKEVQYGDMRATGRITIIDNNNNEEIMIGIPIDQFLKMLDEQLIEVQNLQSHQNTQNPPDTQNHPSVIETDNVIRNIEEEEK